MRAEAAGRLPCRLWYAIRARGRSSASCEACLYVGGGRGATGLDLIGAQSTRKGRNEAAVDASGGEVSGPMGAQALMRGGCLCRGRGVVGGKIINNVQVRWPRRAVLGARRWPTTLAIGGGMPGRHGGVAFRCREGALREAMSARVTATTTVSNASVCVRVTHVWRMRTQAANGENVFVARVAIFASPGASALASWKTACTLASFVVAVLDITALRVAFAALWSTCFMRRVASFGWGMSKEMSLDSSATLRAKRGCLATQCGMGTRPGCFAVLGRIVRAMIGMWPLRRARCAV